MLNKENCVPNYYRRELESRSPLKNIDLNTFNFIFSTQKKSLSNKKNYLSLISPNKSENFKLNENFKFEFTNNDILDICEELKHIDDISKDTTSSPSLLSKKRKRKNFVTINSLFKKNNFIRYSIKNKNNSKTFSNNKKEKKTRIKVLTYNILNPICMKKDIINELSTDERMKKICDLLEKTDD